jgi:hypothetical protein
VAKVRRMTKKRLGELLVDEGLITDDQVQEALADQKKTGELLGEVLVRKSYVTERDIARTLATQFSLPYISARRYNVSKEIAELIPDDMLGRYQFVPIDQFSNVLTIVVSGVVDNKALDEIEKMTGCTVKVCVGTATDVKDVRQRFQKMLKGGDGKAAAVAVVEAVPAGEEADELEAPREEDVAELIAAMSKGGAAPEEPAMEQVETPVAEIVEEEPPPEEEKKPAKKEAPKAPPKEAPKAPAKKKAPAAKAKPAKKEESEPGERSSKPQWTRKVTRKKVKKKF